MEKRQIGPTLFTKIMTEQIATAVKKLELENILQVVRNNSKL